MTMLAFLRDRRGASAAEFALVLPLFLFLLFSIVDAGRYMWNVNRAEKAAQMGVRMAVVTDFVSSAINANYVGQCATPLTAGDPIPANCFSTITCSKTGSNAACTAGTPNTVAFNRVANHMRNFMPELQDSEIQIIYSPSGLGYAGNPDGPDVAPLVTVRLSGVDFNPIATLTLASVVLPEARSTLTFEDGIGSQSN